MSILLYVLACSSTIWMSSALYASPSRSPPSMSSATSTKSRSLKYLWTLWRMKEHTGTCPSVVDLISRHTTFYGVIPLVLVPYKKCESTVVDSILQEQVLSNTSIWFFLFILKGVYAPTRNTCSQNIFSEHKSEHLLFVLFIKTSICFKIKSLCSVFIHTTYIFTDKSWGSFDFSVKWYVQYMKKFHMFK